MNTLVTATQHLSQPCGPLPVKDCRVRYEGNENGKNTIFEGGLIRGILAILQSYSQKALADTTRHTCCCSDGSILELYHSNYVYRKDNPDGA